jgi:hypothetical protein
VINGIVAAAAMPGILKEQEKRAFISYGLTGDKRSLRS